MHQLRQGWISFFSCFLDPRSSQWSGRSLFIVRHVLLILAYIYFYIPHSFIILFLDDALYLLYHTILFLFPLQLFQKSATTAPVDSLMWLSFYFWYDRVDDWQLISWSVLFFVGVLVCKWDSIPYICSMFTFNPSCLSNVLVCVCVCAWVCVQKLTWNMSVLVSCVYSTMTEWLRDSV